MTTTRLRDESPKGFVRILDGGRYVVRRAKNSTLISQSVNVWSRYYFS